ncbi:carboxypeptidase regulatory-like domain-containing protein [Methanosarcina sp. KYL-1]|uniref:carboxypeptidase-like regulatory domain-containing protein n=1 Tax=Methanosarcina sp. KYL-1 TaxID=2602068 RepID=UPI002101CDC7|nr:carboxypeptidase-like regulatory domain-containing protein [Methanosarcina sp. KYL-1]MCQ1534842.1 carboxypeptidase regulatory-like domain-containing protein [Methanosarcina sp. KYL-1]
MEMKCLFYLFLLFFLLSTAATANAFEDTIERYENSYADYWSTSSSLSISGGVLTSSSVTVTAVPDPRGIANTALKLYATSTDGNGYSCIYCNIRTNGMNFPQDYFAFTLIDGPTTYGYTGTTSYELQRGLYIYVYQSGTSTKMATYHSMTTTDETKYEVIQSGSYFDIYGNGVLLGSIANSYPAYTGGIDIGISIGNALAAPSSTRTATSIVYLDDFTTGSCIGIPDTVTESSDTITFTWSEQLARSYPDSSHDITLYSITGTKPGEISSWTIPGDSTGGGDEAGYIVANRLDTFGENFGLCLLEITRGSIILADTYFYYSQLSNPGVYPDVLFYGGSDVATTIQDDDLTGGDVDAGDHIYLIPAEEDGTYNFTYTIQGTPYAFEADLEIIYGAETINSTTFSFLNLYHPYEISLDGGPISDNATAASGSFLFLGNLSDGDSLSVDDDCYEFDDEGNISAGNLIVSLNSSDLNSTTENLLSEIVANGTADVSASLSYLGNWTLLLTANTLGHIGNLIPISTTAENITASGPFLSGGTDYPGKTYGESTWSYTVTDWTNLTTHIFSFTPDLTMPGIYGYVKNSATQDPIQSATVTISNGTVTYYIMTDENGMYLKTTGLSPGQYTVSVAKSGYTTAVPSYTDFVTEGATTRQDLYLDIESGAGIYYAPHDVLYTVWEYWYSGEGLSGVSYRCYDNESELIKSGTTDDRGSFVVEDMDQGTRYRIDLVYGEQTYTEYFEPGLSEYIIVLNKGNIVHEYYNDWLNLTYSEGPGSTTVLYTSTKAVSSVSLAATATNGTEVYSQTSTEDNGNFTFSYPEGDYLLQFRIQTEDGNSAAQSWAISYSASVDLVPDSYPAWLKNLIFVAIILIFLMAFGKGRSDVSCGSAAVLTSLGYKLGWLICSFGFVVLVWIVALGGIYLHQKRTGGVG